MDDPRYVYLKFAIDSEGGSTLVGAWEGEPEIETQSLGPVFRCKNYPGCYCIRHDNREVPIYCPRTASTS